MVEGVESLVLEHGSVAILGPRLKEEVMPAAEAAQAMGAQIVSNTLDEQRDSEARS